MTDFLAVYFFLIFAWLFLLLSFWFRYWLLYIAGGFCWGMNALYTITHAHAGDLFIWAYSLFSLAMAIVMVWGNWWLPKKKMDKDEYSDFNTSEDWVDPKEKKGFQKRWGKTIAQQSAADLQKEEVKRRREKGEWVDDPE